MSWYLYYWRPLTTPVPGALLWESICAAPQVRLAQTVLHPVHSLVLRMFLQHHAQGLHQCHLLQHTTLVLWWKGAGMYMCVNFAVVLYLCTCVCVVHDGLYSCINKLCTCIMCEAFSLWTCGGTVLPLKYLYPGTWTWEYKSNQSLLRVMREIY